MDEYKTEKYAMMGDLHAICEIHIDNNIIFVECMS